MNWQTITVQQFQQLHKVSTSNDSDEDKSVQAVAILYNMTEAQVDDMDLLQFKKLCAKTAAVLDISQIPGKPETRIGNYKIVYNPAKLKHRQYVEINHWVDNQIENMHLIMASLVVPIKWNFWTSPNKSEHHEQYATDILQQPFYKVYQACVFFCELYKALIEATAGYLENNNMTTEKDVIAAQLLRSVTDGYTQLNR